MFIPKRLFFCSVCKKEIYMLTNFSLEVGQGEGFTGAWAASMPRADIKEDTEALTLICHKEKENMLITHREAEKFIEAGIPLRVFVPREDAVANNLDCAVRNLTL